MLYFIKNNSTTENAYFVQIFKECLERPMRNKFSYFLMHIIQCLQRSLGFVIQKILLPAGERTHRTY